MIDIDEHFVHLALAAIQGRPDDAEMLIRKAIPSITDRRPDLMKETKRLIAALADGPIRTAPQPTPIPIDADSRLELLKREDKISFPIKPTWPPMVASELQAVLNERNRERELTHAGLTATRSMLFIGAPGVGKTLAARWLAKQLGRPLLTLDLAAVMSSFLGKTGNNIRVVLEYAKQSPTVLLLDEFDAIAKRRDDSAEIGELKRLVTVLVQAVDDWPADGVLIAATNHPEMLDPAVWRRFDRIVRFPLPTREEIASTLTALIRSNGSPGVSSQISTLSALLEGKTFAEVTRAVLRARRDAVLNGSNDEGALLQLATASTQGATLKARIALAAEMRNAGRSDRNISVATGVSRDTLRKHLGAAKDAPSRRRK